MSNFRIKFRNVCLVLGSVLALSTVTFAQSTRGALAGTVTDSSGAVVTSARIVATQVDTHASSETVSSSSGAYHFTELPIGRYDVTVTATGFAASTSQGVLVTINSTTALNVSLKPGEATASITVDASAPSIDSESSEVGGTISQQQIEDLPLSLAKGVNGMRSPETFVFLVPGTAGPGTGTAGNSGNGVFFSRISGGQAYGAEVMLDGASITRSENGSSFDETSPSIEALQEFKVTTSTPSAEYGRTTAGFESFSTKSGTNSFHGTGYFIVKNAAFDANNWFNNGYETIRCTPGEPDYECAYSRPKDSKFDFGGTFSGPVLIPKLYNGKDRSFFLFSWEQYQFTPSGVVQSTVPTAAEKGGDFSELLTLQGAPVPTSQINPCTGDYVLQNQIFDPATTRIGPTGVPCRDPFPGNIIPTTRFSAAGKGLLAGLPDPNQTATLNLPYGFTNNYVQSSLAPITNTAMTVRGDQALGQKNKVFFSYSSRENTAIEAPPALPGPYNWNGWPQDFFTHYIRGGWDYTITPTLLNHLNIGYNRTNSKNFAANLNSPMNLTALGAPNFYSTAFPHVCFDGYDGYSCWGQTNNGDNIDNGLRFNDSVSWIKGRHSLKFGVDWRHQQYSVIQENIPYLSFLHSETDYAATATNPQSVSGNSLASLLLGEVDYSNQTVYNHNSRWQSWYVAGFAQDDIKVSPSLTLNVGVRYDIDAPRHEAQNFTSAFNYTAPDAAAGGLPGALVFGTNCQHCNTAWADTWYKDIAPRIGFAYLLPGTDGKMVLRGGGAIIYGPLQYSDFGSSMVLGYSQFRQIGSNYTGPGTAGGFTPAFQLDTGYDGFAASNFTPSTDPTQLTGAPGQFNSVGGEVIKPSYGRPSMTSSWSLQIQDELAKDLIFTLGYLGQSSQNLHSGFLSNDNNISTNDFALGDQLDNPQFAIQTQGGTSVTGVQAPYSTFVGNLGQAIRPFPQYDYIAGDCCLENLGHSSYEAMIVSLNRRFRQGFNLQLAYTWSKNETDADSTIPFSYAGNRSQTQNSSDFKAEKSVSIQNTPQQLSISYLYQFPFGKGRKFLNDSRALDLLVGGWELGGIQRYQSGQPIDFQCATGIPYYQNCIRFSRGAAATYSGFASDAYRKNKNHPSIFNGESWFKSAFRPAKQLSSTDPGVPLDEAAFVDENREGRAQFDDTNTSFWLRTPSPDCNNGCSLDPFVFGTGIPRVTEEISGPLYLAEDFSLLKNFTIRENVKFQFKVEAIDAFNRHRMALPDTEPGDYLTGVPLSGGFGVPGAVDYGPRNLQFTGRINF
jgi:Carboxypeptidase regulatory-like domain